jgi:hypothetical protein
LLELQERCQHRVLLGIIGVIGVSQHRARHPAHRRRISIHEHAERAAITGQRSRDQLGIL